MLDAFVERQIRTQRGNKVLIGLRLLLATVSLAVLLIQEFTVPLRPGTGVIQPPLYLRPPGLVTIIVCALTILYLVVARRSEQNPSLAPKLAFLQVFVDIFLISALIWNTGGVSSQFVVLYLMSISAAAFVLKWNVAILAAAVSATLFSLVTLSYSLGWIPESFRAIATQAQIERLHSLTVLDFVRLLLLPVCAFFLAGLLAGTLSRRLTSARLMHNEILEGIGEGIVVVDSTARVLYHNREFEKLVNGKIPIQGAELSALFGNTLGQQVNEVLKEPAPRRVELQHPKPGGGSLPLVGRIRPICDPDEKTPRGVVVALDDITAEKKMEEFQKHRQRIETMGHISATIAHEIRNPLASIRGAVQEIGRSLQIPENKKILLDIVLSESDRLDQIITEFLRFARMRPPKLMQTDVGRVLSDIKLLLATRPEAKGVTITLSGDEGDPFLADAEQLRQLFLNLGVNALQAMDGCTRKELNLRVSSVNLHQAPGFDT
ncbi:MAG TPA: histidine kinase dimerization/phospho-acceptor domain-containing protein, partial [Planctomycetota bacterium]|nr:histidine kinase dimerization/phospho-acceptor domain-containing protein [Planctomycetota bacterium]